MTTQTAEDDGTTGRNFFIFLFMFPVILVAIISSIVGYIFAKGGASEGTVRFLLFPANFIITNVISGVIIGVGGAGIGLIIQSETMVHYCLSNIFDLTLFSVWGRVVSWFWNFGAVNYNLNPGVEVWHVVLFQVVVWIFLGNSIAQVWTRCVMKFADR